MPNPFAPRSRRLAAPAFPAARLQRLGASEAQIALARRQWYSFGADERAESAASLAELTDLELAADIAAWGNVEEDALLEDLNDWAQQVAADGTYPTDEAALDALDEWAAAAAALTGVVAPDGSQVAPAVSGGPGGPGEAATDPAGSDPAGSDPSDDVPRGSIPVVLAWVAEDRKRAQRALDVETANENRKTLTAELERILA